jgi:hypothetical protein
VLPNGIPALQDREDVKPTSPATASPVKASSLESRSITIERDSHLLKQVQSFRQLASYSALFASAGLTSGKVRFEENDDRSNLYEIIVEVLIAAPGKTDEETEGAFRDALDLRDLADNLTKSGSGEFFDVEIDFATFETDFVVPIRERLALEHVEIDS